MTVTSLRRLILIFLLLALGVALSIASPAFLTLGNIMTLLQEASLIGIIAVGFTFVMITGGIDISVGAIVGFAAMICVNFLVYSSLPVWLFVPVVIAIGGLIGLVNGFFITRFRLPEFIVTLATRGVLTGLALVIAVKSGGFVENVFIQDPAYLWFGSKIGPVHVVTIAFILIAIIGQVLLKQTRFGTNVYATGANRTAAKLSGVNTDRIQFGVYAMTGICSAIAAVFLSARMMTGMPEMGAGSELMVIAAVVIGGTSFTGGVGDIPGTVLGVLFLALIQNGILKLGLSPYVQPIVIGGIITVTVIVDVWYKSLAERMISRAARQRRAQIAGQTQA